jgi:hypothetical protein
MHGFSGLTAVALEHPHRPQRRKTPYISIHPRQFLVKGVANA